MKKFYILLIHCCFLLLISNLVEAKTNNESAQYQQIPWEALIPKEDLDILLNPPESIWEIEDGSAEDNIESLTAKNKTKDTAQAKAESRYMAALKSSKVVKAFDNKNIKLPGFIVPLVTNEQNKVTEFFIVPYFGACLHMPPPPPNQIVFATQKQGFELESLQQAFWFEGNLTISTHNNELGDSAYSLSIHSIKPYDPFEGMPSIDD